MLQIDPIVKAMWPSIAHLFTSSPSLSDSIIANTAILYNLNAVTTTELFNAKCSRRYAEFNVYYLDDGTLGHTPWEEIWPDTVVESGIESKIENIKWETPDDGVASIYVYYYKAKDLQKYKCYC